MADEYQKELFSDYRLEKGKIKKIADKMTSKKPALVIQMPLENILVGVIIFLLAVIVSFAAGVEKGKHLVVAGRSVGADNTPPETKRLETVKVIDKEVLTLPIVDKAVFREAANINKPYTIQLTAYTQKLRAEKLKDKLLNKKLEAFIIESHNVYQVCVGYFKDREEAKIALRQFKGEYNGCFVRKK